MKFVSTRGGAPPVSIGAAIAAGLAPDGGLYVPEALPHFKLGDFDGRELLPRVAARLLAPFFEGDDLISELHGICTEAFNFPTRLVPLSPPSDYMLELFHGPTAAFKDFGARFLAACMRRIRRGATRELTILVATSGDTGAAVAAAFAGVPGIKVCVLYPDGRVSPRQAHQLGCFGGNVRAFRVAGSFDDCQLMVKQALNDYALQETTPLSSANSISLGRLLPQMSYYAHAALEHWRSGGHVLNFVVPTGNLGNALACIMTRTCGLPIGEIALASNANRVLPDFFAGNAYTPRASVATLANAMDVGAPSNFERLRWLYPDERTLRSAFRSEAVDDEMIRATVLARHTRYGQVLCPHTATAACMLTHMHATGTRGRWAIVATAHPAKFDTVVEPLIGDHVQVPATLAALLERPSHAQPLAADYAALRAVLTAN